MFLKLHCIVNTSCGSYTKKVSFWIIVAGLIYPPSIWRVRTQANTTPSATRLLLVTQMLAQWPGAVLGGRTGKERGRLSPRRLSMLWALPLRAHAGIYRDIKVSLYPDIPWRTASENPARSNSHNSRWRFASE